MVAGPVDEAPEDPLDQVNWAVVEKVTGAAHRVVTETTSRLIWKSAQISVATRAQVEPYESVRLIDESAQISVTTKDRVQPSESTRLIDETTQIPVRREVAGVRKTVLAAVGGAGASRDPPD